MSGFTAGEGRVGGRKWQPGRIGGNTPVSLASVSCTKTQTAKYIPETLTPRYIAAANFCAIKGRGSFGLGGETAYGSRGSHLKTPPSTGREPHTWVRRVQEPPGFEVTA